jgi:serine/threonine-protein kinase
VASPAVASPPAADDVDLVDAVPHGTGSMKTIMAFTLGVLVLLLAGLALALRGPGALPAPAAGAASTATNAPAPGPTVVAPPARASLATAAVGGTIPVGITPAVGAVNPNGRFAYVTNLDPQTVTVLNTATRAVVATIPVPAGPPRFVALAPDGRTAYLSVYDDFGEGNVVAVLDTATNTLGPVIPVDRQPFALALAPDRRTLWVPSHDTATVDLVDTVTARVVKRIRVAPNPVSVTFGGGRAYVADDAANLVTVLNQTTGAVITTIRVGTSPRRVAVSPDGRRAAVVNFESNNVSIIDTANERVVAVVPVGVNPQDVVYAPDGRHAYVADVGSNAVSVIDTATDTVSSTVRVGAAPTSIALLPDGRRGYVTCLIDGTLTVLNTAR